MDLAKKRMDSTKDKKKCIKNKSEGMEYVPSVSQWIAVYNKNRNALQDSLLKSREAFQITSRLSDFIDNPDKKDKSRTFLLDKV